MAGPSGPAILACRGRGSPARLSSAVVDHPARRSILAARLPEIGASAFLVSAPPNVRYLTGFTGSNGQLVLSAEGAVFLTDGRYTEQSRREVSDLPRVTYAGDVAPVVAKAAADLGALRVAFEATHVSFRGYQDLSATGLDVVPSSGEVERLRWAKDPEELDRLRAAQQVADLAFQEILGALSDGVTEKELALVLDTEMRRRGADGLAFDTIAAFGEQAAEPHHSPTDRPLRRGDVVKLDFGCVAGGYHSDMTRTVAFGEPPTRLREVYEAVRRAQQAGVDAVRAGTTGGEVDRVVRALVVEAGYGDQFSHPTGHGVGLEIHEGPWLRPGGPDLLPEGAVVTVEPGIYLGGLGGVRIEDMVEVTAEGSRVISRVGKDLLVL